MKRYFLLALSICVTWMAFAQKMSVKAPSSVVVGENFRLEYTVHLVNIDGQPQLPDMPDGLRVVYGPSISQQESYSNINGHSSVTALTIFTFMIQADKEGTFTIPAAKLHVGGRTLVSDPVSVKATKDSRKQNTGTTFHPDDNSGPGIRSQGTPISQKDIFFKVTASKTHVYEQEPIVLTYKLCYLRDVQPTSINGNAPDVKGFQVQEITVPDTYSMETINGRTYVTRVFKQYLLYPQMVGTQDIPRVIFKAEVPQRVAVDPMEAFFNGGSDFVVVPCDLIAEGMDIRVDSLPSKPAGFSGGVGKFNISAQIDKEELKAGDPINIRVVVGGMGNLKLLKQPEVILPKDFDKFDAKITDKTELTANGVEGNMIYDFLAVPRNQGEYTIPAIKMTYFDIESKSYKTIETEPFQVKVLEGDGSSSDDYADYSNKDIRPIKEGKASLYKANEFFFGSRAYWLWIAIPLLLFIALLTVFRKRAIDNANITKMRGKKANKVATRRLKVANKLMLNGDNDRFYDEVLRALWGYVGDKLNMPVEQLSRDNVSDRLTEHGVEEGTVEKFIQALDECEFERYAPGDSKGNMNRTFEAAMNAIMKIEDDMKSAKGKTKDATPAVVLLLLLAMIPMQSVLAVTKESADEAYKKGNYQQAIKDYEQLLKEGVSAKLYFNLGNAYYRTEDMTKAILNYERAYMLSPGDEDIRFNLQLARTKTIDKINPQREMFFVTWYKALVNFTSVDRWAAIAVASIILALILILLYLFSDKIRLRKIGFYGAVAMLVLFILSNIFAYQQKQKLEKKDGAIIMTATVNVKKTPDSKAENAFVLHEGTKVEITDKTIKGWRGVRIIDGREGWLQDNCMEEI